MRIFTFDIETTDFKANFGNMLMWAGKFVDEDQVYYDVLPFGKGYKSKVDDGAIVQTLVDKINESDAVVFHYGTRFDLPFVNTRCLEHDIIPPRPVPQIDTWKIARNNLALTSNRLASVADFVCDDQHQKGSMSKTDWKMAAHGEPKTLNRMLDYCIGDVLATEQAYLRLRPFITNHPYVGQAPDPDDAGMVYSCPACGHKMTKERPRRTRCFTIRMLNCRSCGLWTTGKRRKIA